jgi:hypothetical protein
MRRVLAAVLSTLAAIIAFGGTSSAAPSGGCVAVTARITSGGVGPATCRYVATGPGQYVAVSASGYQIRIEHVDGSAETISSSMGSCSQLLPYVPPGPVPNRIPSEAGDVVTVTVRQACYDHVFRPTPIQLKSPLPAMVVTVPPSTIDPPDVPPYQVAAVYAFNSM